mgnify:CR=1 FL=1
MDNEGNAVMKVISNDLFGRLDIYASSDDITAENVVSELNTALPYHVQNLLQEDFLYWYRRNVQPILRRTKEVRPEILNIVQENHADEIVAFKNGYFLTKPAFYVACGTEDTLYPESVEFTQLLRDANFDVTYEEWAGIHSWDFWRESLPRGLKALGLAD